MEHPTTGTDLKNRIINDLIQPSIYSDVKSGLRARACWNNAGHVMETTSRLFMAASGVLSFASGFYKNMSLAFAAGTASTISLALIQFASYCFRESKHNSEDLNAILDSVKIEPIPVMDDSPATPSSSS